MEETDAAKAVDLISFALYHETASSLGAQDNDDMINGSKERSRQDDDEGGSSIGGRYVSAATVISLDPMVFLYFARPFSSKTLYCSYDSTVNKPYPRASPDSDEWLRVCVLDLAMITCAGIFVAGLKTSPEKQQ